MAMILSRRAATVKELVHGLFLSRSRSLSSRASTILLKENKAAQAQKSLVNKEGITSHFESSLHLSSLFLDNGAQAKDYKIELVDDEIWRVSTGLANAWRGATPVLETKASGTGLGGEVVKYIPPNREDPDIDEIEDMRVRGNLFFKLDRDSKEFEEYNYDFHRRKSSKTKGGRTESKSKEIPFPNSTSKVEKSSKKRDGQKESKKEDLGINSGSRLEWLPKIDEKDGKRVRTPTFNQLTAPYHEPFCLDIYISKASVRACIVHRATSKVVAVAHSISKDMKFDLESTKNATACAAVGVVLAQRALADDIHNVVYTPRKGEKLEGKLQIVLQSVICSGLNVKVKIKQRKLHKASFPPPRRNNVD